MSGRRTLVTAVALVAALAAGCDGAGDATVPTIEVAIAPFEIRIEGRGELKAAQATPIDVPGTLQGVQRIAWLQPEAARVASGEVVARLDGEQMQQRRLEIEDELTKLDAQLAAKRRELEKERTSLEGELALLEQERDDVERFAPRDERLYSRHAILDAQIDLDLIASKIEHAVTRAERYEARARAELEILGLQRRTQLVRLEQVDAALSQLEIRAPHDGFFLRGRTWQGETMRVGLSVWPGSSIGELPDVSVMEATVYVLESEAAGLADGLAANVRLDAYPERSFAGTVEAVQPVANPIDRDSPVKYFEVVVALERTETGLMRPKSQITAELWVTRGEERLTVPNQAIFHEGDRTWVWAADDDAGWARVPVELGPRSLSRTVVVSGLEPGVRVALIEPPGVEAG